VSIVEFLLGRRLANREAETRKIGAFEGIPAMGLDALGSSAYGPEAALTIMLPLGAAGLAWLGWVMAPIVLLLAILFASYWQTTRAYPNNGGAYFVARENLGTNASLLAAAALMTDYVLNVAVGISAGVGALVSAVPELQTHTLALCLAILAAITLINLRGTPESGRVLAVPTYTFVACFVCIVVLGVWRTLQSGGHPAAIVPPPSMAAATEAMGPWLLLRAIASGCTAMTGVEAISNGVGAFREPRVRYAHRTLSVVVAVLGFLLAGVAWLARRYTIGAMDETKPGYQSVLAQLAGAVVGHGVFYYVALASLLAVLALSANTSFVGFPRLCRIVAEHGFLPKPFAIAGRRLVFTSGILYLACCAGLLLVAFDGITNALIPLFAIGAFLSFTLSQASMVVHWHRLMAAGEAPHHAWASLAINALGAASTGVALVVIVLAKFAEGAWITLLVIPIVIAALRRIGAYYRRLAQRASALEPLKPGELRPPIVVVAIDYLDALGMKGIRLGLGLSHDLVAIHLTHLTGPDSQDHERRLRERWASHVETPARAAGLPPPRLMFLPASRRTILEPMLKLIRRIQTEFPDRDIAVLIPEVAKRHWYQQLLHAHRGRRLRARLIKLGDARLTVISVPWLLEGGQDHATPAGSGNPKKRKGRLRRRPSAPWWHRRRYGPDGKPSAQP